MSRSTYALQEAIVGTDALDVEKLYSVEGRVAMVTGGGTGLGLVTATALAENGARVYITGRRLGPIEEAAKFKPRRGNGKIIAVQADLGSKEGIMALRKFVEDREKWVNVLVNNHGVFLGCADLNDSPQTAQGLSDAMFKESYENWGKLYNTHCTSVYFTVAAFLPLLAAAREVGGYQEPGNVVNIASLSGITRTSQRGQFNYNASKAATIHLTLMQATEFARRGLDIRVNSISPGYFPSGMSMADFKDVSTTDKEFFRKEYGIPFGKAGTAVDYAQCIISLIVNQYITGSNLVIDGSWLATMGASNARGHGVVAAATTALADQTPPAPGGTHAHAQPIPGPSAATAAALGSLPGSVPDPLGPADVLAAARAAASAPAPAPAREPPAAAPGVQLRAPTP